MPRGYFPRKPLFGRFGQADLNDPIEYHNGRRRPFWESMELRAKSLSPDAIHALRARKAFLSKRERHTNG
jgi:hypothetical protein